MSQNCPCGNNCRICSNCEQPACECYCDYLDEDIKVDANKFNSYSYENEDW